jgi:transcriptional regulator with XRE-family HTH domain
MKKQFSDRLREARTKAGLTQEQLGFAVEVSKSSVSAWENGRESPSFKVLVQLREALGCSLDVLICGDSFQFDGINENTSPRYNQLTAKDTQEANLLVEFRKVSMKKKAAIIEMLRG